MRTILIVAITIVLTGCQSSVSLPTQSYTIQQIYESASEVNYEDRWHMTADDEPNLVTHTRHVGRELDDLFPELPNPKILIYIAPHLAEGNLPVPGYVTKISLYKKAHYALPGETSIGEEE